MPGTFDQHISSRYHIYNSLFLNLPFSNIYRTGMLLSFLQQYSEEGFASGKTPEEIIENFLKDFAPQSKRKEQFNLLFNFIQYAERQVVLFDSVEDAAFEKMNDVYGKGTISALLLRASSSGLLKELKEKLQSFSVRVVLTAHPTQFYPGNVLAILNDLEEAIRQDDLQNINLLLQQLGKTPIINRQKPTPFDEAVSLCWYLENVFYHAAPAIIQKLISGLQLRLEEWKNFNLIRIGFWPGGDRDGNPFVTSEITMAVAQRLRETILRCYYRDIRSLKRRFTFRGVEDKISKVERGIYNAAYLGEKGYQYASELMNDLMHARTVLIEEHNGLFLDLLDAFIIKVRMFGFFFASMDIRQDSRKHVQVWNEILNATKQPNIDSVPEPKQVERLLNIQIDPTQLKIGDDFAGEVIRTIEVIGKIQQQNGEEGCHRYVISNCGSAVDVIRVFQLVKLIIGKKNQLPLDVVPLFETIDDLANCDQVMEQLYAIPAYRKHVQQRGDKQTIMLGFSDGTKDGGYLRANWSIFRSKENITRISRDHGITAIFFDGRGGPPARGGGNTHDFYASLGDTIETKEVQITIQGQTISSNFGKPVSCRYNLEQLLSAGIEDDVFGSDRMQFTDADKKLLDELAEAGYKAYLGLKLHPKFVPYLEKATPLRFFGETNIGSRPVKRSSSDSLKFEDLRAIPFVGSWAQMKQNVPGFYGVGSALEAMKRSGKLKKFQSLYKRSLFFRTLLANSMMSLTKSHYPATRYLSTDKEFSALWKKMYSEYNLSRERILQVTGLNELMQSNPINRDSVKLRERMVMPLIAIQQFALQRLRKGSKRDKPFENDYRKLIVRCMFGIINAARNSA